MLRRRTAPDKLVVKMWFHPVLSIATIVGIVAVVVGMYFQEDARPQLVLSVLVWVVTLGLYFITRWRGGSVDAAEPATVGLDLAQLAPANRAEVRSSRSTPGWR